MKQLFITVTGVTPTELAALHALYPDGRSQMSEHEISCGRSDELACQELIRISEVNLQDPATYRVKFQVNAVIEGRPKREGFVEGLPPMCKLLAPEGLVKAIWDALGIFPFEEALVVEKLK